MINDNDDFIVTEGLKNSYFLNKNKNNFCSGKIYYIKKTKRNGNKFFYLSSLNNYGYSKDDYIKSKKFLGNRVVVIYGILYTGKNFIKNNK